MTETVELKRNPHTYREWMASIPFGLTPIGKKLTRIHFVDEVSDGRVSVDMTPGSIQVSYGTGSSGTLDERPGECVIWVYPRNKK